MTDQDNKWITDDPTTSDVCIELGLKMKVITKEIKNNEISVTGLCVHTVKSIIDFGFRHGYLKGHLELGEFYYHATNFGLTLLDSKQDLIID